MITFDSSAAEQPSRRAGGAVGAALRRIAAVAAELRLRAAGSSPRASELTQGGASSARRFGRRRP